MTVNSFQEARDIWERRQKERPPICSVAIATYDKPKLLERTLDSILRQNFPCEIIVVDDGSPEDWTAQICSDREVIYHRIEREPTYRNPSFARNVAYKLAKADILIAQSDDVIHESPDLLKGLCELGEREFHLASVQNADFSDSGVCMARRKWYVHSLHNPRPLFFLGSVRRSDVCAIGGCCESLSLAGFDDDLFSLMLGRGPRLNEVYRDELLGLHQSHERPPLRRAYREMEAVYHRRIQECQESGVWCSVGGPWRYVQGVSVATIDGSASNVAEQINGMEI